MSDGKDEMRLYGTADESNRQPRPAQGYRGEKAARGAKPAQRRRAKSIEVEEESGTAYAERTGAAARASRPGEPDRQRMSASTRTGLFAVGALAAIGAVAGAWWARRVGREQDGASGHAAFRRAQTHPENFDQTRDAGPEHIRDDSVARRWDTVDESSDESFPASDPPATY